MTGITSLVLFVFMAMAMYFLMKIYSAIRAVECGLHTVHDAGMEVTGRRVEQTGVVHGKQQTPIWSVENTGREPEEHDERKIQVSQLRFVKKYNVVVRFWMQKLRHYLLNIILIREEPILGLFAVVSVSSDYSAKTKQPHLQAHIIYFYGTYLIFNGRSDDRSRVFSVQLLFRFRE